MSDDHTPDDEIPQSNVPEDVEAERLKLELRLTLAERQSSPNRSGGI
jgi:hypothetical protein